MRACATAARHAAAPTTDKRTTTAQAHYVCLRLLPAAESQARAGEPRLLAEILRFLRPQPIVINAAPTK